MRHLGEEVDEEEMDDDKMTYPKIPGLGESNFFSFLNLVSLLRQILDSITCASLISLHISSAQFSGLMKTKFLLFAHLFHSAGKQDIPATSTKPQLAT